MPKVWLPSSRSGRSTRGVFATLISRGFLMPLFFAFFVPFCGYSVLYEPSSRNGLY
jgi:hypothetical protein